MKDMFGSLFGVVLGSEAVRIVGNSDLKFKDTTQTFISLATLGNTLKNSKSWFK